MLYCTVQQRVKMAGETFVSLAAGLQNAPDPVPILSEMNTLLESSASEIFLVLPRIPLLAIFACLESSNDSQVESTCLVLNKLLDALPVSTFLELSNFLELGLQHPNVRVVVLCLRQLKRCCSDPSTLPMVLAPTMLHLVTQLMGHERLEVAKATHAILAFLCKEERTRKVIMDERRAGFMGDVDHLMRKNSTVRFRVYDLFTEIAMSSSGAFKDVCGTGVLTQVANELEDRDILLKLNCLEVLIRLLASPEGYRFIEESNVVKKLHDVLHTRNADPLASIVVPGVLKFFGNLSCTSYAVPMETIVRTYPLFMEVISEGVADQASQYWGVAVDTFGLLGSTQSGRSALAVNAAQTADIVKVLGTYFSSINTGAKARSLESASVLLAYNATPQDEELSEHWYNLLGQNVFQNVFAVVRQPFPDLQSVGLKFMKALSVCTWGQRAIHKGAGFIEYLLDRTTGLDKTGKELKYDIVSGLVSKKDTCVETFGQAVYMKLKEYRDEGPFFVKGEHVIAFQDS